MADQDLRSFVAAYERAHPGEVIRVAEPVSIEEDVMALVLEYERRRRSPILMFERIAGYDMPIVCNVVASRRALAFALGVDERGLAAEYARRIKDHVKPVVVPDPPFRHRTVTGPAMDLAKLPIPRYFPGDAGRYLTAGMLVARDPDTGVETEGYHRFQLKGRDRMGVSLHSRRRMFEYQRRAESKGAALPCAIVLGLHPLVSMGSLAYPPADVGKFQVVGGLLGEPLQVAPCATIDLHVPASAEIVIEGDIDVFDEAEVLWAIATRMQADRDLVVISGSLGAMLDPSADDRGITAKLGIDATRPFGQSFAEKLVMSPEKMTWARELVERLAQRDRRRPCP